MAPTRWVRVASEAEFEERNLIPVEAGYEAVVVAKIGPNYFAIEDRCSHDDNPLDEGDIIDGQVVCPRHGGRFDPATGEARRMPAVAPVRTFPVKVEGGSVFVEVEAD
jgi:3-phenylpropionate/trans-cinnamate dioxygenase ferredoxin subunit